MLPIEFLPQALQDLREAYAWYAVRDQQAAERFTAAVDKAVEHLRPDPERLAATDRVHRAIAVRRFPYRVIFRVDNDCITIVAVAHTKRHRYWGRRR